MTEVTTPGVTVMMSLDRLIPEEQYQPRDAGLSEPHVRLLAESDPGTWPPLLISPDGDGFVIIDGFHRREAAQRLGLAALPCVVVPGAGYPEAVAANLRHGLPLSLTDRKEAARWYAEQEPDLSYREIGRRVSLSDKTVKQAVESTSAASPQTQPDKIRKLVALVYRTYNDRHGRTFLGFGKAGNAAAFRRAIETFPEDEQADVARALDAFGSAIVAASQQYMSGIDR
jgi:DNA-binding CsgD family transcriptional regulator